MSSKEELIQKILTSKLNSLARTQAQSIEIPSVPAVDRNQPLKLSFAQQRLWFLTQLEGSSEAYHISVGVRLNGDLDTDALTRALDRIVARHEALRTAFIQIDGTPVQRIGDSNQGFQLLWQDISLSSDVHETLEQLETEENHTSFDMEKGPLVRGRLVKCSDQEHVLMITMHHIISDGWSMGIFIHELDKLYTAFLNNEPDPLSPLPIQYADYSVWQRNLVSGERLEGQANYWKETLSGAPTLLELPTDHPRPAEKNYAGETIEVGLEPDLTSQLKKLSQRYGVTLFMTLLASWGVLLSRLSGQKDVVVGTPSANRGYHEIEELIGFFVNTLAIRIDQSDNPTVFELLQRIKQQTLSATANQDIPFENIVEILQQRRSLSYSPLFQVMFAWQNTPREDLELPGLALSYFGNSNTTAKFDITLSLGEIGDSYIGGEINYASSLFNRSTIERVLGYWQTLLKGMVANDKQRIEEIPILTEVERKTLLYDWNATKTDYPKDKCIHELFEEQVERTPDNIAVVFEDVRLTYRELNEKANQLAHYLNSLGVRPDSLVGVCVERGFNMIIGIMGILKAGGAYVPLDPNYPVERLTFMLKDCVPVAVLTDPSTSTILAYIDEQIMKIDMTYDQSKWADLPNANVERCESRVSLDNLAYVIYTSGSTGQPKGVMVEHDGLNNYVQWAKTIYKTEVGSIVSSSLSFDATITSLYIPLLTGFKIRLLPEHQEIDYLEQLLNNSQPQGFVKITPAHLDALGQRLPLNTCSFEMFVIGGEALQSSTVNTWRKHFPEIRLINEYGPTETVVGCIAWDIPINTLTEFVHIGKPIANTQIYILDHNRMPVPIGVTGELYIGGVQVARGYLNQPELTAERFLRDPFVASNEGETMPRMYKTGDLARWLPNGNIEYLGRTDFQVKIRGFRIELGEIEARLSEYPQIREVAVIAREDVPGDKRLVAYYVAEETNSIEEMRKHLSASLPEYMVPAAYIKIEAMPLTSNGKLDRKALPEPEGDAYLTRRYEAPQGEIEKTISEIWAELLKLDKVGRYDNFFELGGHSLLAIALIERFRRANLHADVRAIFKSSTLADLATVLTDSSKKEILVPPNQIKPDTLRITPDMLPLINLTEEDIDHIVGTVPGGAGNIQDIYALAPLQEGILFHHLLVEEGDPYILSLRSEFDSRERLDKFLDAMQTVIDRHDILRTSVVWEGLTEPAQVVWRKAVLPIEEVNLIPGSDKDIATQLNERVCPKHYDFDLKIAPLYRVFITYNPARDCWLMLLLQHHLIADHTTLEIIFEEILTCQNGEFEKLPQPQPFRNFIAQTRLAESKEEHEAFFRNMLGDIHESTAPFGLTNTLGDGTNILESCLRLNDNLAHRIRRCSQTVGVSTTSLFHLAWAQVLSLTSGRQDVVFGTVLFGRMQGGSGSDRILGLFINTLPIRVNINGDSVINASKRVHSMLIELLVHEHASLSLAQRCSAVQNGMPLFTSLMNYRYSSENTLSIDQCEGIEFISGEERTNYPITLSIDDLETGFSITAQTDSSISPDLVCSFMNRALEQLIDTLETGSDTPICRLDVIPVVERQRVLYDWNSTKTDYPKDKCIHELFEEQVKKTPDNIAVVFEDVRLTYRELNEKANQLAYYLIENYQIQPDDLVGVLMDRSEKLIIVLLGILKSGAAYLPIDSEHPNKRIKYILEDSGAKAVIICGDVLKNNHEITTPILNIDSVTSYPKDNPGKNNTVHNLAYVIYTSGSTGRPKGTLIEHGSLTARLTWLQETYPIEENDKILLKTTYTFDVSVSELFWWMLAGSTLVVLAPGNEKEPMKIVEIIEKHAITHMNFVPSMLTVLLADERIKSDSMKSLKYVFPAGEALQNSSVKRFFDVFDEKTQMHNLYGPTEATIYSIAYRCLKETGDMPRVPIGRPISNTMIYIINPQTQQLLPIGVSGELCLAGIGLARGYLNQPDLTDEKFVPNPFIPGEKMYRTGDLARWLPDGNIEYLGRMDFQVKIRGFRIELGEIEARLAEHPKITAVAVIAREDVPGEKRLIAYYVAEEVLSVEELRKNLSSSLPEYMVPAAYVRLEAMPLNSNGKLERKALPAPDGNAYLTCIYEAPQGKFEQTIAEIWSELLHLEKVGRYDNFFELGGHSLMVITLIERLRRANLHADVRTLFKSPNLSDLATALTSSSEKEIQVPPNKIQPDTKRITPDMLPLINLTQEDIDNIVDTIPGGVSNIQDIYALAPLQEGILFHHLVVEEGDPYVSPTILSFDRRERLDGFLGSYQTVISRHDILRTSVVWKGLTEPAQVVWRNAVLPVEEVNLISSSDKDIATQLSERFSPRHYDFNLEIAPLSRAFITYDSSRDCWLLMLLMHHLTSDHTTLEIIVEEILACQRGQTEQLPVPQPFRNFIAQARLGMTKEQHEIFFRKMLGDIDDTTAPFGLTNTLGDGTNILESHLPLDDTLAKRIRECAKVIGVSPASLFHLAWAKVLSLTSGRQDVVFGTVLFGRMQAGSGSDRMLGLFINTLPVRININEDSVINASKKVHSLLIELLAHEHASLALAQRCSAVQAGIPLFTALMNYRYSSENTLSSDEWEGIEDLGGEERDNYPISLSVDDLNTGFSLTLQTDSSIFPERVCNFLNKALEHLVEVLETDSNTPVCCLDVLPAAERQTVLYGWNSTKTDYPKDKCIHELFEEQVAKTPDAVAVVYEYEQLTYAELNCKANQLARYLGSLGVGPDSLVGLCVERGLNMMIGIVGILKAGGAYVPLDSNYPAERLEFMLKDCATAVVLVEQATSSAFTDIAGENTVVNLTLEKNKWNDLPNTNLEKDTIHLSPKNLAYIIYTSGTTGQPKGVMIEHGGLVNQITGLKNHYKITPDDCILQFSRITFDMSIEEIFPALVSGARLVIRTDAWLAGAQEFWGRCQEKGVTITNLPTKFWSQLIQDEEGTMPSSLRQVMITGEAVSSNALMKWFKIKDRPRLFNVYGPTETTVNATIFEPLLESLSLQSIGRPVANTSIYILDKNEKPVPMGIVGEMYIGGVNVGRGYLNRPELTAERFLPNPFAEVNEGDPIPRMYKTGDLARYLPDGNIEYLGRTDFQVKIRGFRIELGEIEARLAEHPHIREIAVLAREDASGDKRLMAYYVVDEEVSVEELRKHLLVSLPEYMIPAAYIKLEAMPVTSSGKLDRKALPLPEGNSYLTRTYEPPQGEIEQTIADIWAELLHLEKVGRYDNFFELGGHSLLAVQVTNKIQRILEVDLPVSSIFERPALSGFSDRVVEESLKQFEDSDIASILDELDKFSENELLSMLERGEKT